MSLLRRSPRLPPTAYLQDLARAVALGTALGVPAGVLLGALEFPYWARTVTSFAFVLGFFLVPVSLIRLALHGCNAFLDRGYRDLDPSVRVMDVGITRWPVVITGGLLVCWLWLVVASGVSTGDWTP